MGKMKTHKGVAKRMKVRPGGTVKFKKAGAGHLMSGKSGKRCRNLRQPGKTPPAVAAKIREALKS
jgi:large subunit ribosomal protein L35